MQKRGTWLIVVAYIAGWILAPLVDPPSEASNSQAIVVAGDSIDAAETQIVSK